MNHYNKHRRKRFTRNSNRWSITVWLILVNVAVYLGLTTVRWVSKLPLEEWMNTKPVLFFALKPASILQGEYISSIFLHMFTHLLLLHLLVNMFVLFSLGGLCEKIIGRKRYFWFYIIGGLFGGILSVLLAGFFGTTDLGARIFGSPLMPMVGASGAIFAIAGLYMVLLPRLKFMIIFLPFFSLPAKVMIPLTLFGIWILSIIFNLPIGNVAHFGGFMAGVVYGLYLKSKYKRKILKLQRMFR